MNHIDPRLLGELHQVAVRFNLSTRPSGSIRTFSTPLGRFSESDHDAKLAAACDHMADLKQGAIARFLDARAGDQKGYRLILAARLLDEALGIRDE